MRLCFFAVPPQGGHDLAAELNHILGKPRIVGLNPQPVADGASSCWAICVSFGQGGSRPELIKQSKVDFNEILSEAEFAMFARLRALRKQMAENEGVPAYALCTNEQLADMVQRRVTTAAGLRQIAGVGEARLEKYGPAFLDLLAQAGLPVSIVEDAPDAT